MRWGEHRTGGGPTTCVPDAERAPGSRRAHLRGVDAPAACDRSRPAVGRAIRPARPTVPCALVVTLALMAGACGGADGGSGGSGESGGAPAPDRLAVPLGTDPAAVAPYVDELLSSYNASVNEIAATPTLAVDAEAPAVSAFVDLFEPGSEPAAAAVDFWRNQGVVGESTRPYTPGEPAFATRLDGAVETVSDDEVTFPTCVEVAFETVNAQGQRVDVEPGASVPGEGAAVRVDGEWRLRRLDQFTGTEGCRGDG